LIHLVLGKQLDTRPRARTADRSEVLLAEKIFASSSDRVYGGLYALADEKLDLCYFGQAAATRDLVRCEDDISPRPPELG